MNFGNAGIQLTIKLDEKQVKMITEFIFERLKEAKKDLEFQIDDLETHFNKEIELIKGKLP